MDPDPDWGAEPSRNRFARELAVTSIGGGRALPIAFLPPPPHQERRQSAGHEERLCVSRLKCALHLQEGTHAAAGGLGSVPAPRSPGVRTGGVLSGDPWQGSENVCVVGAGGVEWVAGPETQGGQMGLGAHPWFLAWTPD